MVNILFGHRVQPEGQADAAVNWQTPRIPANEKTLKQNFLIFHS